ncbi:MAG: ATP-dependent helicase [Candidatus Nitrosocaldaceae archaeon]|nr:MAG: ATP-dependent helicase [Candidatus Nitrosocaldaceae archaeon]
MLESFYGKPRELQIEAIDKIEEALRSGYKDIILSAPTGVGKSYIAICLALAYSRGDILTATTDLQNQYLRDFPFVQTIMGRRNFSCIKYSNRKEVLCSNIPVSECKKIVEKEDKKVVEYCDYYPTTKVIVKGFGREERVVFVDNLYNELEGYEDSHCSYYCQRLKALASSFRIFNYHEYLSLILFSKEAINTEVLICDEAHLIENLAVDFFKLTLSKKLVDSANLSMVNSEEVDKWLSIAKNVLEVYKNRLEEAKKEKGEIEVLIEITSNNLKTSKKEYERTKRDLTRYRAKLIELLKRIAELEEIVKRLEFIVVRIDYDKDNFIVNLRKKEGEIESAYLIPLNIGSYLQEVFSRAKIRLFMSATVDYQLLKRELALEEPAFIDLPSPFDIKNRLVFFTNSYKLNKDNMDNEDTIIRVANTIDSILNKHKNERGLILVTSYKLANNIYWNMSNKDRILLTNDIKRREIIDKHLTKEDSVILSPSLWEGIDLRDELCRFIIIAKMPYLDLSDKRVREKSKDRDWYEGHAIMRLIQGSGRGVRNDNDYCITYVLDSSATWLIKRRYKYIPAWFRDAMKL